MKELLRAYWGRFVRLFLTVLVPISCSQANLDAINAPDKYITSPGINEFQRTPPSIPGFDSSECNFYASPFGDDSGQGNESEPWRSFQRAADTVKPGDTICFREGLYPVSEEIHINRSGTSEALVRFTAYPGERPILDGMGGVGDLVTIDPTTSYLHLSGFTVRGFTNWGITLAGENRYITLDHLMVEGGEAGIRLTYGDADLGPPAEGPVEYVTLEDSLIYGSQYTAMDCSPGPCDQMVLRRLEVYGAGVIGESSYGADGLAIARGYPVLVEDCYIHDNGGDGIDLNSRDRQGHATGVIVRRNRVVRNRLNGIKLWAGGLIENNIVWGQGNSAVWVGSFDGRLEVINNTIAYNMWDPIFSERNWAFVAGYPEELPAPQVHLMLVNNIFAFNTGSDVGEPTGIYLGSGVNLTEHHNLYYSWIDGEITAEFEGKDYTRQELEEGEWTRRTGQGEGDLTFDPMFLSGWPKVNLQLPRISPAIDAGDNAFCPESDYRSITRPIDGDEDGEAICDLGAYEFQ